MTTKTTGTRRRAAPAGPALPKITVGRFEDCMALMERVLDENVDLFIAKGEEYRARHREKTTRPLSPIETAQIAAGLATSLEDAQAQVQAAELVHRDEAQPSEVLIAAGISTAPAFMLAVRRLTALLELPADDYENAREGGLEHGLWPVVDAAADKLRDLDLDVARARAQLALEHLAGKAGVTPGKAWSLVAKTIWQAMSQAAGELGDRMRSASSISSAANTAGPDEPSSTSSTTETPSSS